MLYLYQDEHEAIKVFRTKSPRLGMIFVGEYSEAYLREITQGDLKIESESEFTEDVRELNRLAALVRGSSDDNLVRF